MDYLIFHEKQLESRFQVKLQILLVVSNYATHN
jgi:hypothetical protein